MIYTHLKDWFKNGCICQLLLSSVLQVRVYNPEDLPITKGFPYPCLLDYKLKFQWQFVWLVPTKLYKLNLVGIFCQLNSLESPIIQVLLDFYLVSYCFKTRPWNVKDYYYMYQTIL